MSRTEIFVEIPKLAFAGRQELFWSTIKRAGDKLTREEKAILDQRIDDFRGNPHLGTPAGLAKTSVLRRLAPR